MTTDIDAGHGFNRGRKIEGSDWPWREVKIDPSRLPLIPQPVTILADPVEESMDKKWVATNHADGSMRLNHVPVAAPVEVRVAEAKQRGYTGDVCGNCAMFTMRRNGTCNVCDTCGTTTGCS